MSVKQRLMQFAKEKERSVRAFEKKVGLTIGYVNSIRVSIQPDKIQSIASCYPDLNTEWLLTGEGGMLKVLPELNETKTMKAGKGRPHVEVCGILGFPNGFTAAIRGHDCEMISIPFVSNYDFSIMGWGDSMINRKNPERSIYNGDIIACRFWKHQSHVRWGQLYVLSTSDGVIVKQVQKSERDDHVKCVSFNEEDGYLPYDLPISEIHDWAIVVYVVHTSKW